MKNIFVLFLFLVGLSFAAFGVEVDTECEREYNEDTVAFDEKVEEDQEEASSETQKEGSRTQER